MVFVFPLELKVRAYRSAVQPRQEMWFWRNPYGFVLSEVFYLLGFKRRGVEAGHGRVLLRPMNRFPAGDDPAFTTKLLWLFQMKQCCHWLMVAGQLLRFIEEYDFGAVHLYRTLR